MTQPESPRWPFWLRPAQVTFGLIALAAIDAVVQFMHRAIDVGVSALPQWAVIAFATAGLLTVTGWVILLFLWTSGRLLVRVLIAWSDVWETIRGIFSSRGRNS